MQGVSDVAVVGSGPSGLMVACYIVDKVPNVSVTLYYEDMTWSNTLSLWTDEIKETWAEGFLHRLVGEEWVLHKWAWSSYRFPGKVIRHRKDYAMINNDLCAALFAFLRASGAILVNARQKTSAALLKESGGTHDVVFDCSGICSTTLSIPCRLPRCFQPFVGCIVTCRQPHDFDLDVAVVMDWCMESDGGTFAYILPLDDTRLFVEETVLLTTQIDFESIESSLTRRLAHLHLDAESVEIVEKRMASMIIPVLTHIPRNVAVVGTKAGDHNPVTGYHVAYMWSRVPSVVQEVLTHGRRLYSTDDRAKACIFRPCQWLFAWMSYSQYVAFFSSFLSLAPESVYGFLSRKDSAARMLWTMTGMLAFPSAIRVLVSFLFADFVRCLCSILSRFMYL